MDNEAIVKRLDMIVSFADGLIKEVNALKKTIEVSQVSKRQINKRASQQKIADMQADWLAKRQARWNKRAKQLSQE